MNNYGLGGYSDQRGGRYGGNHQNRDNHGGNRRGGFRSPPNNRSGPYNRDGNRNNQRGRNTGSNQHHRRNNEPSDISRYIKASFFEDPWRHLAGPTQKPQFTAVSEPLPIATPSAPQPIFPAGETPVEPILHTSASKLGLSLPPPKQQTSATASKFSNFLSKLPPPKTQDSAPDHLDLPETI
jgi:hypothetical protein